MYGDCHQQTLHWKRRGGSALLGITPSFLNFCNITLWLKPIPAFGPGHKLSAVPLTPPKGQHSPQHTAGTSWGSLSHTGCQSRPSLSHPPAGEPQVSWGLADRFSQLQPSTSAELRHITKPGISSLTSILQHLTSSKPAEQLCAGSVHVCMPGCMQISFPKAPRPSLPSVLWRCATPQMEKPCGAILFYFLALLVYDNIVSTLCNFPQMISMLFNVDSKAI